MSTLLLANPKKRRKKRTVARRKTTRRYRRNPINARGLMATFQKGAIGAGGALAVDLALQKLPIPANLTTGAFAPLTRGFLGVGIGMIIAKLGKNKRLGEQVADGAVTVALYTAGKNMLGPTLGLADDGLLGMEPGLLGDDWMDDDEDLGYMNPAAVDDRPDFEGYQDTDF